MASPWLLAMHVPIFDDYLPFYEALLHNLFTSMRNNEPVEIIIKQPTFHFVGFSSNLFPTWRGFSIGVLKAVAVVTILPIALRSAGHAYHNYLSWCRNANTRREP